MAYAKHSNQDVHSQILAGIVPSELPIILGGFDEKDHSFRFEYAERRWPDDSIHPELPHVIYVESHLGGPCVSTRLAKVLGTVAYVLVDEDVIEKWYIKNHNKYVTDWVGRS
jgi:hypothetical protein